jgi:hypothetical protein
MDTSGLRAFISALVLLASVAGAAGAFTIDRVVADLDLPADAGIRLRHGEVVQSAPEESSDRELGVDLTPADFADVALEPDGAAEANRYLAAGPGETLMAKRLTGIFERSRDSFQRSD